jgi:HK97 family phage portal protein
MPLLPYSYKGDWKQLDSTNNLYNLLNVQPNALMSRNTFFKQIVVNLLLNGNAYIVIDRDKLGQVVGLYLINSNAVLVTISGQDLVYSINGKDFDSSQVIHIINNSYDGIHGLSTISYASDTLNLGYLENQHSTNFYKNGGIGGILTPALGVQINSEKAQKAKKTWRETMNLDGSNSIIALDSSMQYQPITVSNKDSMLIESKQLTVRDIARFFGVPISLLMLDSTYSSAEQEQVSFTNSLNPLIQKIENEFFRKLYMSYQWDTTDLFFDIEALYRTDLTARADYYTKMFSIGGYTVNEIREKLNSKFPAVGGNRVFINVQVQPLDNLISEMNATKPEAPAIDNKIK